LRFRRKPPLRPPGCDPGVAADEGEAEEVEGFRFPEPASLARGRRAAAELNQAGLVRVELERERRQPLAHRLEEAAGVGLMLETFR